MMEFACTYSSIKNNFCVRNHFHIGVPIPVLDDISECKMIIPRIACYRESSGYAELFIACSHILQSSAMPTDLQVAIGMHC